MPISKKRLLPEGATLLSDTVAFFLMAYNTGNLFPGKNRPAYLSIASTISGMLALGVTVLFMLKGSEIPRNEKSYHGLSKFGSFLDSAALATQVAAIRFHGGPEKSYAWLLPTFTALLTAMTLKLYLGEMFLYDRQISDLEHQPLLLKEQRVFPRQEARRRFPGDLVALIAGGMFLYSSISSESGASLPLSVSLLTVSLFSIVSDMVIACGDGAKSSQEGVSPSSPKSASSKITLGWDSALNFSRALIHLGFSGYSAWYLMSALPLLSSENKVTEDLGMASLVLSSVSQLGLFSHTLSTGVAEYFDWKTMPQTVTLNG